MFNGVAYRTEVIGSLLRPPEVKQAMSDAQAGRIGREELEEIQDRAILGAISLQEECGMDVITDGEYRRMIFWDPVIATLDGLTTDTDSPVMFGGDDSDEDEVKLPTVTGKLSHRDSLLQREMSYLLEHTNSPTKATMPAMAQASALWLPGISEDAYPSRNEYMEDLVRLMREDIVALDVLGVDYIQLDSPRYTYACSEEGRDRLRALGIEPESWLGEMIAFDNALMEGFDNITFGLHLCRGNHRSMWAVEGGYDPIAERLFNELKVERLLLEYDSPRAGTFEPLRLVPEGKVVVLGLISSKEARVETREEILPRIEEAAQFVPVERLALSPQCGFASTLPGNLLGEEEQRQKLELISSVADEVWG
jgi:5-methyltetrahydropteroyltriglutamate--homocysteine methyltransferase